MASKKKKNQKIVKYRKPINFNIGMIVFGGVFIYILVCVVFYFNTKHIIGYEVTTGSLSVANVYEGIALREEKTISANDSGYINYFARESSHVACGDLVFTVDPSGTLADMIEMGDESVMLSDEDMEELKTDIIEFDHVFSKEEFAKLYDFKYSLQGAALKMSNYNMLNNVDKISGDAGGNVRFGYAPYSGTVVYSTDGYENLQTSQINKAIFEKDDYEKKQLIGNELISGEDCVYKMITSEDWSIVVPMEQKRAEELVEEEYVEVKFLKNQYKAWGAVSVLNNGEETYVKLDFNNSMSAFATERFIDIEILDSADSGLKIPVSAIVEKNFFLIPKEYLVKGGASTATGFMVETYSEDGTADLTFVEATLYSESETDYYVDMDAFKIGSYICVEGSEEKYAVSKTGSLIGVYNMNKGYADFTEITILGQNEEYAIVKSNTRYGLTEYDHIVLDAESVSADDFIY